MVALVSGVALCAYLPGIACVNQPNCACRAFSWVRFFLSGDDVWRRSCRASGFSRSQQVHPRRFTYANSRSTKWLRAYCIRNSGPRRCILSYFRVNSYSSFLIVAMLSKIKNKFFLWLNKMPKLCRGNIYNRAARTSKYESDDTHKLHIVCVVWQANRRNKFYLYRH